MAEDWSRRWLDSAAQPWRYNRLTSIKLDSGRFPAPYVSSHFWQVLSVAWSANTTSHGTTLVIPVRR